MVGPFVQGFMLIGVLYYYSKGMMSLINEYYRDEFKTYLKEDPEMAKLRKQESADQVKQEAMDKLNKVPSFEGNKDGLPASPVHPTQPTIINAIEKNPSLQGAGYSPDNSCSSIEIKTDETSNNPSSNSNEQASGPPKLDCTRSIEGGNEYKPPPPTPDDEYKPFMLKDAHKVTPSQLYPILEGTKGNNIKTSKIDNNAGDKLITDSSSENIPRDEGKIANQQLSALNTTNLAKPMLKSINGGNYPATPSGEIGRVKKIAVAVESGCIKSNRPTRVKSDDIYKWRANCKPKSVNELVQFWSGNEAVSESIHPATKMCNRN